MHGYSWSLLRRAQAKRLPLGEMVNDRLEKDLKMIEIVE